MDIGNVKQVSNLADVEFPQARKAEQVTPVHAVAAEAVLETESTVSV